MSARHWARGKLRGDPAYRAVLERLPDAGLLLDVGCGEGYLLAAAHAARPALALHGIDHDRRRLDLARRALADVPALTLDDRDATQATLPPCDVIACLDVLHYLPFDRQDALLDALVDGLRPGGLLVIRDAEPGRGWRSAATIGAERLARVIGRHRGAVLAFRSLDEVGARCAEHGLAVEIGPCADGTPFSNRLVVARRA
ncbi:MAG: methyltransferase [Planctomycetota bacterium]